MGMMVKIASFLAQRVQLALRGRRETPEPQEHKVLNAFRASPVRMGRTEKTVSFRGRREQRVRPEPQVTQVLPGGRALKAHLEFRGRMERTGKIASSLGRKERPAQRALPVRLASKVLKEYRASLAPKV